MPAHQHARGGRVGEQEARERDRGWVGEGVAEDAGYGLLGGEVEALEVGGGGAEDVGGVFDGFHFFVFGVVGCHCGGLVGGGWREGGDKRIGDAMGVWEEVAAGGEAIGGWIERAGRVKGLETVQVD